MHRKHRKLISSLREHAEWAHANEWETPITLGDDLEEAIKELRKLIYALSYAVGILVDTEYMTPCNDDDFQFEHHCDDKCHYSSPSEECWCAYLEWLTNSKVEGSTE